MKLILTNISICLLAIYSIPSYAQEPAKSWDRSELNISSPANPQVSLTEKSTGKINFFFKSMNYQEKKTQEAAKDSN